LRQSGAHFCSSTTTTRASPRRGARTRIRRWFSGSGSSSTDREGNALVPAVAAPARAAGTFRAEPTEHTV